MKIEKKVYVHFRTNTFSKKTNYPHKEITFIVHSDSYVIFYNKNTKKATKQEGLWLVLN
jgi:hypothetical protein